MSLSFDNPLQIGNINAKIEKEIGNLDDLTTSDKSSLVNAINELEPSNGATKSLSNLDDTGNARLHALKAYADKGELLTDAEGLADVISYKNNSVGTGIDTIKPDDYKIYTKLFAYVYDTHTIYANSSSTPTTLYNADGSYYTGSDWVINGTSVEYNGNAGTYTDTSDIVLEKNTPIDAGTHISDDGSICTFDMNTCIDTGCTQYATASSWEIIAEVTTASDFSLANHYYLLGSNYSFLFAIRNNAKGRLWVSTNGTSWNLVNGAESTFSFATNTKYWIKIGFTGAKYYVSVSTDGENYTQILSHDSTNKAAAGSIILGRWFIPSTFNSTEGYWHGNINLNTVKTYINGNLVYQPCLKIPYTESKYGVRVVDAAYRDRVMDMYNQYGYANFFTLDEVNNNFTVPMSNIYGLAGQMGLRKNDTSGINRTLLFNNRIQLLTGSCTSGVEVALRDRFADSNYMLSVPYSAKSATAFTPTVTGDWFAIGEGLL